MECFWGFLGLSCVTYVEPLMSLTESHLFSVLLEAHALLSFIMFLSNLTLGCLHNFITELGAELLIFSSPWLSWTYSYFYYPEDAEIPLLSEFWFEKIRDQPNRRNTITPLMGMGEDHSLLAERRRRIGKVLGLSKNIEMEEVILRKKGDGS